MKNQLDSLIIKTQTLLKFISRFLDRPIYNNQFCRIRARISIQNKIDKHSEMDSQKLAFSIGSIIVQSLLFVSICISLNACKTGDSSVSSSDSYVDTTSPTITEISPANGSSTIRGGSITVTFSEEMDTSTITTNTTDNTCSGTIQVSNDDFNTCVQMAEEPTSDVQHIKFSVVPISGFEYDGTYQIKIGSTVSDISGAALQNSFNSSFTISHVKQLSVGVLGTCALLNDGSVYCWGRNPKLGIDDWFRISEKPEKVEGIVNAKILSANIEKCIINDEDEVQCWSGAPDYFLTAPKLISNIANPIDIQSSTSFSCALLAEGAVKCWGNNYYGQLGNGTLEASEGSYHEVPFSVLSIIDAVQIQTGTLHACALRQNNTVSCWGANDAGQIGVTRDPTINTPKHPTPVQVPNLTDVEKIALEGDYSCALLKDGTVKCWGWNDSRILGAGTTDSSCDTPIAIEGINDAIDIYAGYLHACVITTDASVKCWGGNFYSQLGVEDTDSDNDPDTEFEIYPIEMPFSTNLVQLALGSNATCGLYEDHSVKCWGCNYFGHLGDISISESRLPITIEEL